MPTKGIFVRRQDDLPGNPPDGFVYINAFSRRIINGCSCFRWL